MQAVESKRNPATRIGIAALAVVILTAITLGIIVFLAVDEESALTPAAAAPNVNRFEQIKLLEDNIPLPVYAGSPARSLAEMQLMEENVEFQPQMHSRSYLDIQLVEENIDFQTQVGSPALSHLDIKLIEDNVALPVFTGSSVRIHANMQVEE